MRTYKLTISYDGTRYQGWQRQATTDNTIQHILEWSIGKLVGYRVRVDGSGRTDAGVHARGQVASVQLSKLYDVKELKDSINRYLPEDIRIMKVELMKNGFHARKSAKGKKYEEVISESHGQVAEGVYATRAAYDYSKKNNIYMPITEAVYNVLFNDADIRETLNDLMSKEAKSEGFF